ncbi:Methyltransferase domain protein [Trichostrongylus colubriformis]|uniref:Methyltransferase domain protein n=1 Tax=Trichostrongylus colubriformis TaxID=6319 RepID=A0AAN8IJ41_TRICO
MSNAFENEYVHTVYSRLATYQKKDHRPSSPRIWPNVRKFLESQAPGSIVIDVGCGEAKYTCPTVLVLGVDTCADALIGRTHKTRDCLDLLLADALTLPFR